MDTLNDILSRASKNAIDILLPAVIPECLAEPQKHHGRE